MKVLFESENQAVINLNVLKRSGFDIRNNLYIGFIAFSRKSCGTDFLRAVVDGRLQFGFLDATDIYDPIGYFYRNEGSFSSAGLSYRLTAVVENDLPFRYDRKNDVYIKNMKKDAVEIVITGIDKVSWKSNLRGCIEKGANGVLPDGDYPDSLTACATKDKNFY